MRLLDYIKRPVESFMKDFGPIHYEAPAPKYKNTDIPEFVPEEYRTTLLNAANSYDFNPRTAAAILNTENTPWDPTLKNPLKGSTATGLGQHTDAYYKQYGPIFEKQYGGRKYDRNNPHDAIAATFIGLSDLKKRLGNEDDAIKAYHAGVSGYQGKYKDDADKYHQKVMSYLNE